MTAPQLQTARARDSSRIRAVVALLSLGLSGFSLWTVEPDILGLFHDDGLYVVVAKSISEGQGYRLISLPSSPPQTKYPFLYSYILSWVWRFNPVFPDNVILLKTINVVIYFFVVVLSCVFYRASLSDDSLDIVPYGFLVGTSALVFSLTDLTLSDSLFLAFTLAALILSRQSVAVSGTLIPTMALGVVVGLAYLTRQAGLCLIIAGFIQLLAIRQYRKLLVFATVVLIVISPWLWWLASHPTLTLPSSLLHYYVSYERALLFYEPLKQLQVLWGNTILFFEGIDWTLMWPLPVLPWLRIVVYPIIAIGLCLFLRSQPLFHNCFFFLYLLLVLFYQFHPHRYILPFVPLVWVVFFTGIETIQSEKVTGSLSPRKKAIVTLLVRSIIVCLITLNVFWLNLYMERSNEQFTRALYGLRLPYRWDGFKETFAWVRNNTRSEDILATAYDPMYYLYTGRRAVRPWFHNPETYFYPIGKSQANIGSAEQVRKELKALKVRYLVIDPMDGYAEKDAATALFAELLRAYPVEPELVFSSSDSKHKVYLLDPE